jgi:hypothetical protein
MDGALLRRSLRGQAGLGIGRGVRYLFMSLISIKSKLTAFKPFQ